MFRGEGTTGSTDRLSLPTDFFGRITGAFFLGEAGVTNIEDDGEDARKTTAELQRDKGELNESPRS